MGWLALPEMQSSHTRRCGLTTKLSGRDSGPLGGVVSGDRPATEKTVNRTTAVETWREVCGSDMIMALPPTGRMLEAFAAKIEAAEREACAKLCDELLTDASGQWHNDDMAAGAYECAAAIRAR